MAAAAVHLEERRVSGVRKAARQVNHLLNMKMTVQGNSLFCVDKELFMRVTDRAPCSLSTTESEQ